MLQFSYIDGYGGLDDQFGSKPNRKTLFSNISRVWAVLAASCSKGLIYDNYTGAHVPLFKKREASDELTSVFGC